MITSSITSTEIRMTLQEQRQAQDALIVVSARANLSLDVRQLSLVHSCTWWRAYYVLQAAGLGPTCTGA
jgi:hypothetical protein